MRKSKKIKKVEQKFGGSKKIDLTLQNISAATEATVKLGH